MNPDKLTLVTFFKRLMSAPANQFWTDARNLMIKAVTLCGVVVAANHLGLLFIPTPTEHILEQIAALAATFGIAAQTTTDNTTPPPDNTAQ